MNYAIILAGGTGQRMRQSGMPKQFLDVYGKPIIIYTLETFQEDHEIDGIIIPCNKAWIDHMKALVEKYRLTKVKWIVEGGKDRTDSVLAGLKAIEAELKPDDIVMIHDGVRPLVQQETIDKNIELAKLRGNPMTVQTSKPWSLHKARWPNGRTLRIAITRIPSRLRRLFAHWN